jgi:hypothetical protein
MHTKKNTNENNDLNIYINNNSYNGNIPNVNSKYIYEFDKNTFGENKYLTGGNIYIVQTNFLENDYYKIGITTNLKQRLSSYNCGAVIDTKLHYYYPCDNIKLADKILKKILIPFNHKKEIYKTDNLDKIRNKIMLIQQKMNSDIIEIKPTTFHFECIDKKYTCIHCNTIFNTQEQIINHIKNDCNFYKKSNKTSKILLEDKILIEKLDEKLNKEIDEILNKENDKKIDVLLNKINAKKINIIADNKINNKKINIINNNALICNQCNKTFTSYQSRWNHIKNIHNNKLNNKEIIINIQNNKNNDIINDNLKCKYCNKIFTTTQSKYRHMKHYCNEEKKDNKIEKSEDSDKLDEIETNHKQLLKEITKKYPNYMKCNIISFNKENISIVLTYDQKLQILNAKDEAHNELSNMIYNNDNQNLYKFRNILISTLSGEFCKVYDDKMKNFITKNQKDIIKIYADNCIMDIKYIYDENYKT